MYRFRYFIKDSFSPPSYFYLSLYYKQTHINYGTSFSLAVTVVIIDIGERDRGGAIQAGELAATPVARHLTRRNTPDLSAINSLAGEGEGEHNKNQKSSHVAKRMVGSKYKSRTRVRKVNPFDSQGNINHGRRNSKWARSFCAPLPPPPSYLFHYSFRVQVVPISWLQSKLWVISWMLLTMMSYSPPNPLVLGALLMKQVLPAQTSLLHFASSLYPYLVNWHTDLNYICLCLQWLNYFVKS